MVWSFFELILSPVVWLMENILSLYVALTQSVGLSIVLLSFTMMLLVRPLRKRAQALEARITAKSKLVGDEVRALSEDLRGEKHFLETEKIYNAHGYHPIHSIGQGASFFVLLPILLSAIMLFSGTPIVAGESFLLVGDLSETDRLFGTINVLPFLMTGITVADARIRFRNDRMTQYKFYGIAFVLFFLVYNMPSALILYWTASNLFAFANICLSINNLTSKTWWI